MKNIPQNKIIASIFDVQIIVFAYLILIALQKQVKFNFFEWTFPFLLILAIVMSVCLFRIISRYQQKRIVHPSISDYAAIMNNKEIHHIIPAEQHKTIDKEKINIQYEKEWYEITCLKLTMGEYHQYELGSVGNIIHWLRGYGFINYDQVQIGWKNDIGEVTLHGKLFATFTIDAEKKMPIFNFDHQYNFLIERQRIYIKHMTTTPNPYADGKK